jgi:hypothetical protein
VSASPASVFGFGTNVTEVSVAVPPNLPMGAYPVTVTGSAWGITAATTITIFVERGPPTAGTLPPGTSGGSTSTTGGAVEVAPRLRPGGPG